MRAVFVTGTDTGVGKTLVTCALAAALAGAGQRVGVMKPVETGCEARDGRCYPADADRLRRFSGSDLPLDEICPYRYAPPVAPAVAAEMAGSPVEMARLADVFGRIAAAHDVTLVEGAGGLLVPVDARRTFADVARDLGLPVLVVIGSRLGAINHALLTLRCARLLGLPLLGYILNHPCPDADLAVRTNGSVLARMADAPSLGAFPHVTLSGEVARDRDVLASVAERSLDLRPVLGARAGAVAVAGTTGPARIRTREGRPRP